MLAKPPQTQIDVPKDHPGLPRLMAAARRLPDLELTDAVGVRIRRQQLLLPGVVSEFFRALAAVIGEEHVVDLQTHLGLRNRLRAEEAIPPLQDLSVESLQGLLRSPLLLGLLAAQGR